MPRTVKHPEERRRELLATAMRLFAEEGYDNVSVRAVARAAGVAPALAYHYFDSKQNLFAAAIEDFSLRCAEGICEVLDNRALTLDEKVEEAFGLVLDHGGSLYRDFFHAEGTGALHDRLSLGICTVVRPHLAAALELDGRERGVAVRDADVLAGMLVYGCIGFASASNAPSPAEVQAARRYVDALIAAFRPQGGA